MNFEKKYKVRITTDGKNYIDIDIKKQYQISYNIKRKKVKIVKNGLGLNSYIATLRGTTDRIEIAEVEIEKPKAKPIEDKKTNN